MLRVKDIIKRNKIFSKFQENTFHYIPFDDKERISGFYKVVVGSDQVWGRHITGNDNQYFLPFVEPEKRISYAASAGRIDDNFEKTDFKSLLSGFSYFSVRENELYLKLSELGFADRMHDAFTTLFLGAMTILMAVCYVLVNPFIVLYTRRISDINYIYPSLPLLFCLVQILSWSRYVGGNLTGIAGYAKQTSYVSLIEAITNVVFSVIFVHKYGIIGVLFATAIALPLKVVWCIYVSDKKVMHRSYKKTFSILGINYLFFGSVVLVSQYSRLTITSYGQFVLWGFILCLVFGIIGSGLNLAVNRNCWQVIKKYILKRR